MTRIEVRTYGTELFARELELTGERAENIRNVFPQIQSLMESVSKEQFTSEGARSGNPWEPQSELYGRKKLAQGRPFLMRYSDEMYRALTGKTNNSVRTIGENFMEFGADLVQFRVHQDWNPKSNYPERKPIDFTMQDERDFIAIMDEYLGGTRNRAGRRIDPVTKRFVEDPFSKAGRRRSGG